MVRTDFDTERAYEDERFAAQAGFESPRATVLPGYFEPGQFILTHAPESGVTVAIQFGTVPRSY